MGFEDILSDVVLAVKAEVGDGFAGVKGYIDDQGRLLAKQAEFIGKSRASGSLKHDDELYGYFTGEMEKLTLTLARSLAMHSIITIERAWNALVKALWGGLRTILSAAGVPAVLLPGDPPLSL